MIQIDRGIPIPPAPSKGRPRGHPGRRLYPWRQMAVGDSFAFPGELPEAWTRIHGRKWHDRNAYEARRMDGAIRIWRVA
jgi:hypothetical protein